MAAPKQARRRLLAASVLASLLALGLATGAAQAAPTRAGAEGKAPRTEAVTTSRHILVRARSVRLTAEARKRLLRIAERYHEATRHRLIITGGTRTALRQAQLMHEKLEHGDNLLAIYPAGPVRPIIAAYRAAKAKRGATRQKVIAAMRQTIESQMDRGVYISRHLQAGAVDVRSRGMNAERYAALRKAVAAERGVVLLDERQTAQPHFHLSL